MFILDAWPFILKDSSSQKEKNHYCVFFSIYVVTTLYKVKF